MKPASKINYFAAIPGRATNDKRLTGLHFRVLMAIAGRDRMSRNGQFCWEGPIKLAARVGCDPKRFSTTVTDLVELGYLETERSDTDKRKRGTRVIYHTEADAVGIGVDVEKARLRARSLTSTKWLQDGNQSRADQSAENLEEQRVVDQNDGNAIYSAKLIKQKTTDCGKNIKRYGADTHEELARLIGGWEVLQALDEEQRKWLEQKCSDGTLNTEDLLSAASTIQERSSGSFPTRLHVRE